MAELLIELLSEEMPARMQFQAADTIKERLPEILKERSLTYDEINSYVSPRHLAAVVDGLPMSQPDLKQERKGPRVDAPQIAIERFLKSTGLNLNDCEQRQTNKGTFLFAYIQLQGKPTEIVIKSFLPDLMKALKSAWPKTMRWGCVENRRWIRPIHSGICVFDGKPLQIDVSFGGKNGSISFANKTVGHRFLKPSSFSVKSFSDYQKKLRDHYVIVDHRERQRHILEQATILAQKKGFHMRQNPKLLEEVTGLVEWPVVLLGNFDKEYLNLPPELLRVIMRVHQKYFTLEDSKTKQLVPHFLMIANIVAKDDGKNLVVGNERVLKARLADAYFFFSQDKKIPLEVHAKKLSKFVFHAKLGTMAEKSLRIQILATYISGHVGGNERFIKRAGQLCKADLVTEMVFEFPDLQGVMGRYYAIDEPSEVAMAIQEHYLPRGPKDDLPTTMTGKIIALADRIDTLVGFFALSIKPTGSKDPFSLRRAALGAIRLLEDGDSATLKELFEKSYQLYGDTLPNTALTLSEVAHELQDFFLDRLKVYWRDKGLRYDEITAVFSKAQDDSLWALHLRVKALHDFLHGKDGKNLLTAYRRASNIVQIEEARDNINYRGDIDIKLLQQREERILSEALNKSLGQINQCLDQKKFSEAMQGLAYLCPIINEFFNQVKVNNSNTFIRINRLKLLSQIKIVLEQVADFSKIDVSK